MNEFLSVIGSGYEITPSDSAKTQKSAVLANANQITAISITSTEEMEFARGALARVKSWLAELEASREIAKKPFLVGGRFVDDVAKTFGADVLTAKSKLETAIKTYANEQEQKRQATERERLRLEREAFKAQEALERAEREKREQESKRLKAIRKNGLFASSQSSDSEGEHASVVEEKKVVAAQTQAALLHATHALDASAPTLAKRTDFVVTDVSLLYAYDTSLCEITPKRREILARIAQIKTNPRDPVVIPGLRIIEDFKV